MRLLTRTILRTCSASICMLALGLSVSRAQTALPQIDVTVASPIRRAPARPAQAPAQPAPGQPAPTAPAPPAPETLVGTIPIVTDQFATITVVPNGELRRNGAATLGDLLFEKPGITGSEFAPGASSRPIIRGLDVNRVRIQEDGVGANGASDLGEDHFVPVDPLTSDQVEVIRGPATLRFGSQAIGGVVESTNNRIPTIIPDRGINAEFRGAGTSVNSGIDGAALLDAGGGNFAMHADGFGRTGLDYRIPSYPYLVPPNPADAPNATQPNNFNGHQPNSAAQSNGGSVGASYIFNGGFFGLAVVQNDTLYHIPGIDGQDHNTRIDAHQTKLISKGEWRSPTALVDTIRFWGGVTDYKHNELGLADDTDLASDGIRQTFTNQEQEARAEAQLVPFDLRFATLTTAIGVQSGHQRLTAPSPDNAGLWTRTRIGGLQATHSTSLSSVRRQKRRSRAALKRSRCLELGVVSTPPGWSPQRRLRRVTRPRASASACSRTSHGILSAASPHSTSSARPNQLNCFLAAAMTRRTPSTKVIQISRLRPPSRSKSVCDAGSARSDLRQPPTTHDSTALYFAR